MPVERWPEIAERCRRETTREVAAAFGVSHTTIGTILRRVEAGTVIAALAAD